MTNQNNNQGDLKSKCCSAPKHTHYMASLSMEGDLCRQCGKKFIPADDPTEHACPYYNDECPSCTKKPLGDQSTGLGKLIEEAIGDDMVDTVSEAVRMKNYILKAYKEGALAHAKALGLLRHPAHAGAYNLENEITDEFLNSLP